MSKKGKTKSGKPRTMAQARFSIGMHMDDDLTVLGDTLEQTDEFRTEFGKRLATQYSLDDYSNPGSGIEAIATLVNGQFTDVKLIKKPEGLRKKTSKALKGSLDSAMNGLLAPAGAFSAASFGGPSPDANYWFGPREQSIHNALSELVDSLASGVKRSRGVQSVTLAPKPINAGCVDGDDVWSSGRCKGILWDGSPMRVEDLFPKNDSFWTELIKQPRFASFDAGVLHNAIGSLTQCRVAVFFRVVVAV